jgi:hypothetical protein
MDLTKASTAATVVVSFAPLAVVTHLPRPTDDPSDFITIPARSGVARTVYVTSDASSPRPVVKVDATPEGGAGAVTTYINANPDAAPVEDIPDPQDRIDPNVPDTSIGSGETYTPTIDYRSISVSTPSLDEPSLDEPSLDEPSLDEPSLDEPSLDEPSLDEVAMAEPSLDEPSLDEPSLDEAAIPNAPISGSDTTDPDAESGFNTQNTKLTQITWKITMSGNTTTSMSTKIFVPNQTVLDALNGATNKQLIIWRRYRTSDVQKSSSGDCTPVRISNFQVIANVPNPTVTNSNTPPDPVNPKYSEPSATIPPGGSIFLTLRVWGDVPGFSPGKVGAAVQSQPNAVVQSTPDEDELLPPNRAPVATNTTAQVNEDTATAIQLTATDPDFDGLTFTTSAPANGTLSTPVGGTVTYTPNPNFFGTDTFTFQAIDVDGLPSNTATVTVTVAPVNDNPVGVTDTVSVAEDSGANAINVLGNDTDADNVLPVQPNTGLSVTAVGSASNGTTALVGGVVQYTPALNYNGPDTFTYTLSDGNGGSAVGTVNVTVTAANDPPVAGPDTKNAVLNAPVTFPATDLLVNDSPGPANEAGQSLSVTAVSNAFNGTVTLSGGQITFTATSSAGGSFNYTVRDSLGAEATGTVTVTVVPSYDFVAVSFPPSGNQGSVIPLVWQYKLNGVAVNTGSLVPVLRIRALTNCTPQATETGEFTENRQTPGNSDFQYSTSTFQWKFNWQTKPFPMGCYNVYIRLLASDGVTIIQDNGPMRIQLRK